MKSTMKTLSTLALGLALALPAFGGSSEHGSMKGMDHGSMKGMDHGSAQVGHKEMDHEGHMGQEIHESTVEGYGFAYHLMDNRAAMEKMKDMKGHDMSQMKSHHLMLYVVGPDGAKIEDAKVGYKVEGPAGEQKTMAMAMKGGYGADVELGAKGTYEIKTKAVVGGKSLVDEFKYDVK